MNKYDEMKKAIEELIEEGKNLYIAIDNGDRDRSKDLTYFIGNYERWYSKALIVIKQLLPNRVNDFIFLYKNDKRKNLDVETYTISDALRSISSKFGYYGPHTAKLCVFRQINMIQSCLDVFDSKIYDIQTLLQADIFDSEIESAKHLLKMGFLRAAGAICGVIIEKHFVVVSANHNIKLTKKNPTIADYNDALKDNAYDTVEWRRIQRLGDIRNLCDHSKDREPTKEEVEELISGVERLTKTVF